MSANFRCLSCNKLEHRKSWTLFSHQPRVTNTKNSTSQRRKKADSLPLKISGVAWTSANRSTLCAGHARFYHQRVKKTNPSSQTDKSIFAIPDSFPNLELQNGLMFQGIFITWQGSKHLLFPKNESKRLLNLPHSDDEDEI